MNTIRLQLGTWESLGEPAGQVRRAVFIDEQQIPESLEWDENDPVSRHCVAYQDGQPVGTGRLLPDGHIGRMAVLADARRAGLGGRILTALVGEARRRGDTAVQLSAQTHALDFYRRHGFVAQGEVYDEVGIAHRHMRRPLWGGAVTRHEWREPARADGPSLRQREWRPERGHGGGLYLLHGLGEHSARHDALATWLCERGWRVRAHDHAGHGESGGRRGVITAADQLRAEAGLLLADFERSLGAPPLLLGHSMGGALAADLVLGAGARVSGLVLSSPALAIGLGRPLSLLVSVLNRLMPELALGNGLDANRLSHDPAIVGAYRADPLVHDRISPRLLSWLEQAGQHARRAAGELAVPTLLLVAGDDRLVRPQGSRDFADAAPAGRVSLHWYDGLYHELFNEAEPARQQVFADLDRWLVAREPGFSRD
jgi:alpha-beta hydrolase superfamily lysophospholipase/predicted GNAT family N-acyltransferase